MPTITPCCGKAPWRHSTQSCVEIKVRYQQFLSIQRCGLRVTAPGRNKVESVFDVYESAHRDTIMKVTNKMQPYRLIYYSQSALHVSGDVFAHHQEHLTLFTVSGSIHPSCCRLASWMRWNWTTWLVRRVYTLGWTLPYIVYSQVLLMMKENIARNM